MIDYKLSKILLKENFALVKPAAFKIFFLLLGNVWRKEPRKSDPLLCEKINGGYLATRISTAYIEKKTGISKRSIHRGISQLENLGWVQIDRSKKKVSIFLLGKLVDGKETWFCLNNRHTQFESFLTPENVRNSSANLAPDLVPFWHVNKANLVQIWHPGSKRKEIKEKSIRKKISLPHELEVQIESCGDQDLENEETTALILVDVVNPTTEESDVGKGKNQMITDSKTSRTLSKDEFKHLESVRAKEKQDRFDFTADEIIAGWRSRFFQKFNIEDKTFPNKTCWKQTSRLILGARSSLFDGDCKALFDCLCKVLKWWALKLEEANPSWRPPGYPSISKILSRSKTGAPSIYFEKFQSGVLDKEIKESQKIVEKGESLQ